MARWKLKDKHYLNVKDTEWEYKEIDQATGRQARKVYNVPRYLDPESPGDCNYPGEIIVSHEAHGRDYVFEGPPTPDMEPLDEEAKMITESLRSGWKHPMHEFDMNYSQSMLSAFEKQLADAMARQGGVPKAQPDISKIEAQIAELIAKNAELEEKLAKGIRRV